MKLLPNATQVYDWGAFVGYGNKCILPFDAMVAGGMGMFVCESDMEAPEKGYSTMTNLNAARSSSVPIIGTYPWFDPGDNPTYALQRFLSAAEREKPHAIWLDMEQEKDANGNVYPPNQISDRLQSLLEGLRSQLNGIVVDIYSRADFIVNYCPGIVKWYKPQMPWFAGWPDWGLDTEYLSYAEIFAGNMRQCTNMNAPEPRPFTRINVFDGNHGPDLSCIGNPYMWIWQATSRTRPAEVKGTIYDHQYDIGWACMPLPDLKQILKVPNTTGEPTMPSTIAWDPSVKWIDRAWGWKFDPKHKLAPGVTPSMLAGPNGYVDFVTLPMMSTNWDGNHMTFKAEETFPGRFEEFNSTDAAVFGEAILDAAIGPLEQAELTNYEGVSNDQNHALTDFLQSWIYESNWSWAKVLANQVTFRQISEIHIKMVETHTFPWGSDKTKFLEPVWQQTMLEYFVFPLKALMDGGHLPAIPILFDTTSEWLQRYPNMDNWLLTHNSWIYMALPLTNENPSTAVFQTLGAIFSYVIPEDSNYGTKPDSTGKVYRYPDTFANRILVGRFGHLQKTQQILDANNVPVETEVFKYCVAKDAAYKFLNFKPGVVPPNNPPNNPPVTGTMVTSKISDAISQACAEKPNDGSLKDQAYAILIAELQSLAAISKEFLG